jgi:VPDSG-CTERM motif
MGAELAWHGVCGDNQRVNVIKFGRGKLVKGNVETELLRFVRRSAAIAMVACFGIVASQAIPINGSISFTGGATLNDALGSATGFTAFDNVAVLGGFETGDYTALNGGGNFGGTLVFNTFNFGSNILDPNPVTLWTVTAGGVTYSFSAASVSIVSQDSNFLNLSGTGTASISGGTYDPTAGTWSITGTAQGEKTLTFSASTIVAGSSGGGGVPDGGTTVLMLGAAFSTLALLKKKLA